MKNKLKVFISFISIFFTILTFNCSVKSMTIRTNKDLNQDKKIIYLTFDDGPSDGVTNRILDVLEKNEVKATFFLIGNQINGLEDTVKRIYNDGHSIGLHTYTHKFKRIYSNENNFINEMIQSREKINEVVGVTPNIIRFPGGSREHLTEAYLEKLHSYNYKIYDWNMETVDGLNPKASPNKLYREAPKGSEELQTIILLLHCDYMHKNTCKALPEIIKYYKDKGYEFKPITVETPEFYFPIKNQ
ncbi:MAG: polysaccharide deacetylase family protein [Solirubrobacterales bacterium]